ncbi:MAG: DEAD/DEAH box helicase [Gemmatimonadales bacterium]|nr:DEAD/DEAH box helicase [Gemmatimonadales bacterium]
MPSTPNIPRWRIDPDSQRAFESDLARESAGRPWHALRRDAERLALLPAFDQLITLDMNRIEELPHQIRVAQQVLDRPMSGRAILADEVGLGKTIEAGIILKELAVRGLARRILVLTPASLVNQWVEELRDKFFEEFTPVSAPSDWKRSARAIASYDRARQPAHARELLKERWDLVIVDEAHKCKNPATARYKLLQAIERRYLLLLTATPLQNDLRELHSLVTLLRPGHLGTWREFRKAYVKSGDGRSVAQPELLRELTSQVMVRTRRASVADVINLPPRRPRQPEIELTAPEARLYMETATLLRDLYREGFRNTTPEEELADGRRKRGRTGKGIFFLECMRLAQRLCSSSAALATSLEGLANGELIVPEYRSRARVLAEAAAQVTAHAKLEALTRQLSEVPDRIVVFTEHLPTVDLLVRRIEECGRPAIRFTGSLSREQRHLALKRFQREPSAVLVSTRAGTEGLNLQFCSHLVNYELPWNPMIVEQRIGRVHRIGQKNEVQISNYAATGTVEEHILRLLHTKIRLFELVVGELDLILGQDEDDSGGTMENLLGELWLKAESDAVFSVAVDNLGDSLVGRREENRDQERVLDEIVAEDPAGRLEKEFDSLSIPGRLRLGYGTNHVRAAPGFEAQRAALGVHKAELLDALGHCDHVERAGASIDYGALHRLVGRSGRDRHLVVVAQAERLPMTLVEISGDVAPALSLGQNDG